LRVIGTSNDSRGLHYSLATEVVVDSRERPLTVGKTADAGERTGGDVF
tara:strand:+ start:49 stop:192 length:144 start_codon:yes stop_codon:yes gene_type:complete